MDVKGYIDSFGFKIFRLRECSVNDEFLIYHKENKNYYQFQYNRLISILLKEFENKKINLHDFAKNELKLENVDLYKLLKNWIDEEYLIIDNLGYKPQENELLYIEENKTYFNTYKKSKLLKNIKVIDNTKFLIIETILMNVLNNDKKAYEWFVQWIAHSLQYPEDRIPTAVIFHGEHGTGKNIICSTILKKIFESNYNEISQTQITSQFNDWAMGKQLILANEVIHNENKTYVPDKLKNLVSDNYIPLRRMHKAPIMMKNYAKYIFTSNHMIPLKIENGDRRFSVFKSYTLKDGHKIYFKLLDNIKDEINNFTSYLLNINIDIALISSPFSNSSRSNLINFNQNSIEEFVKYSKEMGGFKQLYIYYLGNNNEYISAFNNFDYIERKDIKYIETEKLYFLYRSFCDDFGYKNNFSRKNFTQILQFNGFEFRITKNKKNISSRCLVINDGF